MWLEEDDECALYRRLMQCIVGQGYKRADGTIGVIDHASGLPLCLDGAAHHPLAPSHGAHIAHGLRFRLAGDETNHQVVSWAVNRLCRSWRPTSLIALINEMMGTLQLLRDRLVDRGVLQRRPKLQTFSASPYLSALWAHNGHHALELAILDPTRAARLRTEWDGEQAADTACRCSAEAESLCKRCRAKSAHVEKAERAENIIASDPFFSNRARTALQLEPPASLQS